jgi:hypothetical protein
MSRGNIALLIPALLAGSFIATDSGARAAEQTGFHTLHPLRKMKGKLCMVDHEHAGESESTAKKSVAIKLAINRWQAFTAEEYGRRWGSWSNAWAKREICKGGPGNWVCTVTARPCRGR